MAGAKEKYAISQWKNLVFVYEAIKGRYYIAQDIEAQDLQEAISANGVDVKDWEMTNLDIRDGNKLLERMKKRANL